MVLKFGTEPNDIFFLEATTDNGVSIKRYSQIRHCIGSFYSKVVLRHLNWERPDDSLDNLEKFLDEVNGRDYNMSVNMIRKMQTLNSIQNCGKWIIR